MTPGQTGQLSESRAGTHAFISVNARNPWIVVANSRIVKVLVRIGREYETIYQLLQPNLDIDGLDNKGRGRGRLAYGTGQHAYEPTMQESRQCEAALAREISCWLENEFEQGQFNSLVLVAAPQMLGEIRKNLSPQLGSVVVAAYDKDIAGHKANLLNEELLNIVPGPERE
jgi:protein required for attachment to host cells